MATQQFSLMRRGSPLALALALLSACSTQTGVSSTPPATTAPTATALPAAPEVSSGYRPGMTTTYADKHMAAAANPLATEAGRKILRAGGTAIDAAVAMQAVLTLVEPQATGIGGGAFIMYWDGKRVQAYDGRETAPAGAGENLFMRPDGKPMSFSEGQIGGRSVGTPGVLRALELAHRQHGKLPWAKLFEPAIALAEQGFPISPRLYTQIAADKFLPASPEMAAYFLTPDGKPRPVGTMLKNPALASTLRAIAHRGPNALYTGPIASEIVKLVNGSANPGSLSLADLKDYRAKERAPFAATTSAGRSAACRRLRQATSRSRRCSAPCRHWRPGTRNTRSPRSSRNRSQRLPVSSRASTPRTPFPRPGAWPMRTAASMWRTRISCQSTWRGCSAATTWQAARA